MPPSPPSGALRSAPSSRTSVVEFPLSIRCKVDTRVAERVPFLYLRDARSQKRQFHNLAVEERHLGHIPVIDFLAETGADGVSVSAPCLSPRPSP